MKMKFENCGGVSASASASASNYEDCNGEDDFFDPDYKLFLENLRQNGNCFVIKDGKHSGFGHEFCDDKCLDSAGKWKNSIGTDKVGRKLDLPSAGKAYVVGSSSFFDAVGRTKSNEKVNRCGGKCDGRQGSCLSNAKRKKNVVKEYLGDMKEENYEYFSNCMVHGEGKNAIKENPSALYTPQGNGRTKSTNRKNERGGKTAKKKKAMGEPGDMTDEDYKYFLDNLDKLESGDLKFNHNGLRGKYEDDTDSEVSIIDCNTFEKEGVLNPFLSSKVICEMAIDDHYQFRTSGSGSVSSQFREKLLSILKKPYHESEYSMLSREIRAQKPAEYNEDLHNKIGEMYSPRKKCRSYLDHYSDLKRKVESAKMDRHKKLNLFRGFFFYLQNITQPEAFMPWKDKSCLAVMPASLAR